MVNKHFFYSSERPKCCEASRPLFLIMENGQSDGLNALIDVLLVCLVFHPHFDADSVSEVFK